MNGSDRILSRIKSDSDASVRAIEEQARQERDRIIADAQHQADKQAAEIAEQTAQKRARMQASAQSRAQLETRNTCSGLTTVNTLRRFTALPPS